jgi:hypothetical protein
LVSIVHAHPEDWTISSNCPHRAWREGAFVHIGTKGDCEAGARAELEGESIRRGKRAAPDEHGEKCPAYDWRLTLL